MALWLNEEAVRAVLPMADIIAAMEATLIAFSRGDTNQPLRTVLDIGDRSFFAAMPAHLPRTPALGAKLVSVVESNAARDLPTHVATILLFDPATGLLQAVLDGRYITEVRTAAVSAVAVRHLAKAGASTLAILGSGVQARSHAQALTLEKRFGEMLAWSPSRKHLESFAAETGIRAQASAESAVRGADVIVLATSSTKPVLEDRWVKDGALVISVGACRPTHREMDPALVARSRLIVDSRTSALRESGDIVLGIHEGRFDQNHIAAELGDIADGRAPGRTAADEVIVFKSLGLAVEDMAAAAIAYERALQTGGGIELV